MGDMVFCSEIVITDPEVEARKGNAGKVQQKVSNRCDFSSARVHPPAESSSLRCAAPQRRLTLSGG